MEDTDSKERCSVKNSGHEELRMVKRETHFVAIAVQLEEESNAIKHRANSSKRILVTIPMFGIHILVPGSAEGPKKCTLGSD
jgi:hypothetical protein